jgi:hypothetical protein
LTSFSVSGSSQLVATNINTAAIAERLEESWPQIRRKVPGLDKHKEQVRQAVEKLARFVPVLPTQQTQANKKRKNNLHLTCLEIGRVHSRIDELEPAEKRHPQTKAIRAALDRYDEFLEERKHSIPRATPSGGRLREWMIKCEAVKLARNLLTQAGVAVTEGRYDDLLVWLSTALFEIATNRDADAMAEACKDVMNPQRIQERRKHRAKLYKLRKS